MSLVRDASDWLLWIDCDERLRGGERLRWILESPMFAGFVIKQHHLHADADYPADEPVRLFRASSPARFVGAVHEQPAVDAEGTALAPVALVSDALISHHGYVTNAERTAKIGHHPIMQREIERGTSRGLSWALWLRDLCQRARWSSDPRSARLLYERVVDVYQERFSDPSTDPKVWEAAWPHYQTALAELGVGVRVRTGTALSTEGEPRVEPEAFIAADIEEAERILTYRMRGALDAARPVEPVLV